MLCNTAQYTKVYEIGPSSRVVYERRHWGAGVGPNRSRNDADSMHTFSTVPPDRECIHPGWVGKLGLL